MQKILIVEDDADTRKWIEQTLRSAKFEVEFADDGSRGLELAQKHAFALIVLDVNLPSLSGIELCQSLRAQQSTTPILMLSTQAEVRDRVNGILVGADDYLAKPFDPIELIARVSGLLRRCEVYNTTANNMVTVGDLSIDVWARKVTAGEREIELTSVEFDLLLHFAKNPGRVFTRQQLAEEVWEFSATNFGPSVTTLLSRLRSKLELNPRKPKYIKTNHGVGYRFATLDELDAAA